MAQSMPEMADAFLALPILIYTRFGEWDRIKKSPEPPASMPASHATWLYARTLAFLASGDQQRAAHEQAKFEELCKQIPAGAPWGQNKAREVLAMASEVLAARFATNPEDATGHWQRAVDLQDRLVYDEPPAWYYPVRESQGAALLRAGKPDVAETVFREGLRRSPRNGRMLFGLMESLKAQGKQDDAEWVRQEFARSWTTSDIALRVDQL
jgi:Flp pilus assembly protein TadD